MGVREAFDIVIIGAGAAGLAAAAELSGASGSIGILEARERIGGRIFSVDSMDAAPPKQLGAEFIHGESAAVFEWLRRTPDVAVDAPQSRWIAQRGHLHSGERAFERMKRSLQKARRPATDIAFAEFLARNSRTMPPATRALACTLVEGFDAATQRVSAHSIR